MGLKSFNPYTASRRFITVVDKSHITKQEPEKALLEPKKRSARAFASLPFASLLSERPWPRSRSVR